MAKLNLGSGHDIKSGYINLDRVSLPGVDVVADLEKVLPFENDYFEEIYCSHVLEHVSALTKLLSELHRISKSGAVIKVIVPHFSFFGSYTDPTHKRFFGYFTFDYFTEGSCLNFYTNIRFDISKRRLDFYWLKNEKRVMRSNVISFLINLWPLFYERFFCWIIPVNELYIEIKVKKEDK